MVSRLGLTRNQLATVSKDSEVIKQLEKLFATINDLVDGGVPAGAAEALATTGADVDVGLSGPPTVGQVLTATSATTATWQAAGGGGAPATAQFVTLATDATLTNERVLTGSATVSVTDAGAGSTVTLAVPAGSIGPTQLAATAVAAGSYATADITVDADGRITSATANTLDTIPDPVASVDFAQQQGLRFRIENRTSDPASPAVGEVWLRTDL